MIGASRRSLFIATALLAVVSLSVVREPSEAAPKPVLEPPVDAPPFAPANEPVKVGWHILASLNYRTGEPGKELAALDGKLVKVPGFAVPLEDWASSVTEFLLVPYVGACIHTPPPPPNQHDTTRTPSCIRHAHSLESRTRGLCVVSFRLNTP